MEMEEKSLQCLFGHYMRHCELIRNYSKFTVSGYNRTFRMFMSYSGINSPYELSKRVVEQWFYYGRLERKWSAATFYYHHKHLNTFFKWLVNEQYVDKNYLEDMEKPRLEHRLPRTLSLKEAEFILEASFHMPYAYKFQRYRNRAIVAIMLLAGLRRKEVLDLKMNDVSVESRTIFIDQGKGAKDRMIPMNYRLCRHLSDYLVDRKRLNKQCIYFFTSIAGDHSLGYKGITKLMQKLKKFTKLDFSSHTLRHAFARLMLEGGCDIYTLSKIMGHAKITTTTIYLSCSSQQMSRSIEKHALN